MHKDSPSSARQCVPMTHMVSPDTCTCGGNLHSPENLFLNARYGHLHVIKHAIM